MSPEIKRGKPTELRTVGLDEKWLQDRIVEDASLLGLGELQVVSREHRQPFGGRIDFLMKDDEAEAFYEVEVMLGALDESHIIRTIEYWDLERQRRPQYEHNAVIIAEHITSRFFNVPRLLNRSVPMIAIQLSALIVDESVVLHFVKVLDVMEEVEDTDSEESNGTDRGFWEKKTDPTSLSVVDKIVASLRTAGLDPKPTYNRYEIALRTSRYAFCWLHPRKSAQHCHIDVRTGRDARDTVVSSLQNEGINALPATHRPDVVGFNLLPRRSMITPS